MNSDGMPGRVNGVPTPRRQAQAPEGVDPTQISRLCAAGRHTGSGEPQCSGVIYDYSGAGLPLTRPCMCPYCVATGKHEHPRP